MSPELKDLRKARVGKERYAGCPAEQARAHDRVASPPVSSKLREKVPAELWSAIWLLLPSFWDLVNASHVCAGWRAIALADGRLWSSPKAHLISPRWPFPDLSPEEIAAVARREIAMLRLCIERAGRNLSVSIQVDYRTPDVAVLQRLIELVNTRAHDIVELTAIFRRGSLEVFVQGLVLMPALRFLRLGGTWGLNISQLPLSLFPAVEELDVCPYDFDVRPGYVEGQDSDDDDEIEGLGEGKDIVPAGSLPGLSDEDWVELEYSDLENDDTTPNNSAASRASLPALRAVKMLAISTESLVYALRDWLPLQRLTVSVSFEDKRHEPAAKHLSFIRRKFRQLDSLDLDCYWDYYYRVRRSIPRRRRPATLCIGLHASTYHVGNPRECQWELGLAIMDVFDLSPAAISLTIEPCDPPGQDDDWRKHVLLRAHDVTSGRIRQISIHSYFIYRQPAVETWARIRSGLGMSPLLSLTIPWDCVGPFLTDANPETIAQLDTATILVTGLEEKERYDKWDLKRRLPSTEKWPALPTLQHLTIRLLPDALATVNSTKAGENKSPKAGELYEAIRHLVPAPAKLKSLSLHGVTTSSKEREPILDVADKVHDILLD